MKPLRLLLSLATAAPLSALAVPMPVTGDYALSGTTVAARPELAGVVLEDRITAYSFSGAGETVSGEIQHRVVRSNLDGTIDFYWRIRPTGGTGDIHAFRVSGFGGYALDADWRIDGLGTAAPDIARNLGGGNVNFIWDSNEVGRDPNGGLDSSRFFFLDTDATHYAWSGQFDLLCESSGCISPLGTTFAPSEVPLPAAAWLFGSALLGLGSSAMRRKRN